MAGPNVKSLNGGFAPRNTLHDHSFPPATGHTSSKFIPLAPTDERNDNGSKRSPRNSIHQELPRKRELISQRRKRPHPEEDQPQRVKLLRDTSPDPVTDGDVLNEAVVQTTEQPFAERKPRGIAISKTKKPKFREAVSSKTRQTQSRDLFHPKPAHRKPESVDEDSDELTQAMSPRPRRNRPSAPPRTPGAIQKTHFTQKENTERLSVSRAACCNHVLEACGPDSSQQLYLVHSDADTLIPVNEAGYPVQNHTFLKINARRFHKVHLSSSLAPIRIHRSAGKEGGGDLLLELSTEKDHENFRKWLESRMKHLKGQVSIAVEPKSGEELKKIFERCFAESQGRVGQQEAPSPANDLKYLETREAWAQERKLAASTASAAFPTSTPKPRVHRSMRSDPPTTAAEDASDFISLGDGDDGDDVSPVLKRATRSATSKTSFRRSPEQPKWTDKNPEWKAIWNERPLIYPPTGRNSAQVTMEDIPRLEPGELLNDNLIVFYSRHLQIKLEEKKDPNFHRIYFMNPWFYEKLTHKKGRGINYDAVKSWTAKVDLFNFDYILVPVNEHAHWYLAIICYPGKLLPQAADEVDAMDLDDPPMSSAADSVNRTATLESPTPAQEPSEGLAAKVQSDIIPVDDAPAKTSSSRQHITGKPKSPPDASEPRVITFDSLGGPHSPTCTNLREYLVQEAKHRHKVDIEPRPRFGFTAKGIPEQADFSSCGAYLLGYMEEFFKDPDEAVKRIVLKEDMNWKIDPQTMKDKIRTLAIQLRVEQNARLEKEQEAKKLAKATKHKAPVAEAGSPSPAAQGSPGTSEPIGTRKEPSDQPSSGLSSSRTTEATATIDIPTTRRPSPSESIQEVVSSVEGLPRDCLTTFSQELLGPLSSTASADGSDTTLTFADDDRTGLGPLLPRLSTTPDRALYQDILGVPSQRASRRSCSPGNVMLVVTDEDGGESSEAYHTASETGPASPPAKLKDQTPLKYTLEWNNGNNPVEIEDDGPVNVAKHHDKVTSAYFAVDPESSQRSPRTDRWEKPGQAAAAKSSVQVQIPGNRFQYEGPHVDLTLDD